MQLRCATRILTDAAKQFSKERRQLGGLDAGSEGARISELVLMCKQKSSESLHQVERDAISILNTINVLRRHILGLSTTRIMCKIESAGLAEGRDNLLAIIGHFEKFQETIEGILRKIEDVSTVIISNSQSIQARNA